MQNIILVIHILIAIALICVILLQKSEGSGFVGGGGGLGSFLTARSAGNILTKITSFLAITFICTSVILAILAGKNHSEKSTILDNPALATSEQPVANKVTK